jgi:hypothetical protein
VEARDWGRFLLWVEVVVSDRDRDFVGIFPEDGWSKNFTELAGMLGDHLGTPEAFGLES